MKKTLLVATICTTLLGFASAVQASSSATDPRKCTARTPAPAARHGYWCAKAAATTAARAALARQQNVPRWFSPVFCTNTSSLLRWSCTAIDGGDQWKVAVTWRGTSAGWRQTVTVTPA